MKSLLIATTALVSVFSLVSVTGQPARQAASDHYTPDANREFLCSYGFTVSTVTSSSSFFVGWTRVATPVIGKGKKVTEIIVADKPLKSAAPSGFSVAIYTSSHDRPYKELATETAGQPQRCGRIKVPIRTPVLAKGRKYLIVEMERAPAASGIGYSPVNSMRWLYDKRPRLRSSTDAFYQSGACSSSSMQRCWSLTGWQPITGGVPYAKVR
ncbi:MAG: hypothetical protein ACREHF_15430 [Rhizomicrobium sp.]